MLSAVVVLVLASPLAAANATGSVTYVTAKEGFLDVGAEDGLAVGTQVKVLRKKRVIGTCEVVEVAPDKGRCKSDRLYPGDRVSFVPGPKPDAPAAKKERRPPPPERVPDEVENAELREIVLASPVPHVTHKKDVAGLVSARANALLQEQVWSISTGDRTFARTSLDANFRVHLNALEGVPIFAAGDVRIYDDLVAPGFQRNEHGAEIYVYDASLGVDGGGAIVGEVGRFRPQKAPGVYLLDGAQVGTRFSFGGDGNGNVEVGAFGGSIPDLLSGYPGFVYVTGGFYAAADLEPAANVVVTPRARASVVTTPDFLATRGELEVFTEVVLLHQAELGVSLKAVTAQAPDFVPSIDNFRADAAYFGFEPLRISADYRYIGIPQLDFDSVLGAINPIDKSHQASAAATYSFTPQIGAGVTGGFIYEQALGFDLVRGYVGPQLTLPTAFGELGSLEVGYLEELGDAQARAGRSAYVTVRLQPLYASSATVGAVSGLNVIARVSYLDELALGDPFQEAGLMTLVDAPIFPWLSLRGRFYIEQALPESHGAARTAPSVLSGDLGVAGAL